MHKNNPCYTLTCTRKHTTHTNLLGPGATSAAINREDNESLITHDLHNILQLWALKLLFLPVMKKGENTAIFWERACLCLNVCTNITYYTTCSPLPGSQTLNYCNLLAPKSFALQNKIHKQSSLKPLRGNKRSKHRHLPAQTSTECAHTNR